MYILKTLSDLHDQGSSRDSCGSTRRWMQTRKRTTVTRFPSVGSQLLMITYSMCVTENLMNSSGYGLDFQPDICSTKEKKTHNV